MIHANLMTMCFIELELWPIEVSDWGRDLFGSCDLDLNPMTFIYKLDPYFLKIYPICK